MLPLMPPPITLRFMEDAAGLVGWNMAMVGEVERATEDMAYALWKRMLEVTANTRRTSAARWCAEWRP